MEPQVIKTVLGTVIHFLETHKYIELQDDPGTDLDFFLQEFNRFRALIGLNPYRFDRRTSMVGRGDWSGRGEKVRFVEVSEDESNSEESVPIAAAVIEIHIEETDPEINSENIVKKITKKQLTAQLTAKFPELQTHESEHDGKPCTNFFSGNDQVGFWSKGRGWGLTD